MSRAEDLEWCKERAREYLRAGDLINAVASMGSDLVKSGLFTDDGILSFLLVVGGMEAANGDTQAVSRWIEGFN